MTEQTAEEKLLEGLNTKMGEGFQSLKAQNDEAIVRLEKGEQVTGDLKKAIDNQKGEIERVIEKVQEIEQKGIKIHGGPGEKKTFLDLVKSNEEFERVAASKSGSMEFEIKKADLADLLELKFTASGSNLEVPTYDRSIMLNPRQELKIRDLIPTIPVATAEYKYFKEDAVTLGAGMVAEGGVKPSNSATFTPVTDRVKKIAV